MSGGRLILWLFLTAALAAKQISLEELEKNYRDFNYNRVIELADSLLSSSAPIDDFQRVKIYELKAASHYSLNQPQEAFAAYAAILKIDIDHQLDPTFTSPKLVRFFEEVKQAFTDAVRPETVQQVVVRTDTVRLIESSSGFYRRVLPPSMVLPGLGHLLAGSRKSGVAFMLVGSLLLVGAVDATIDCREKEALYLNAVDLEQIRHTYSAYNSAYKTRNALWLGYAVVWSAAQADLVFRVKPHTTLRLAVLPYFDFFPPLLCCRITF